MFLGRVFIQPSPQLTQLFRNLIGGCLFLGVLLVGTIPLALFAILTMQTEEKIKQETEDNQDIASI